MIGESVEFLARSSQVVYDAEHFFDGYKANPNYSLQKRYSPQLRQVPNGFRCATPTAVHSPPRS